MDSQPKPRKINDNYLNLDGNYQKENFIEKLRNTK